MMQNYIKAFIDQGLIYVIAGFASIVVYISMLREDSIMNSVMGFFRYLLLDIGERGIWVWTFETFSIES